MIFYFDFISPYAYLAWTQIHELAGRHGRQVEPAPILFAALLNAHGQLGPAEIPVKRVYVFKDAYRKGHLLGLPPLCPPPTHPFNPLFALRAASFPGDALTRRRFIDALFSATWAEGTGVESEQAVAAIAERSGLPAQEVIAFAKSDPAKAELRNRTQEALAHGVFGVPTVMVDGELFWGTDSLKPLTVFLSGADPVPKHLLERWKKIGASANRKPL